MPSMEVCAPSTLLGHTQPTALVEGPTLSELIGPGLDYSFPHTLHGSPLPTALSTQQQDTAPLLSPPREAFSPYIPHWAFRSILVQSPFLQSHTLMPLSPP